MGRKWEYKTPPRRNLKQRREARAAIAEHYADMCRKERKRRQSTAADIRPDILAAYRRYMAGKEV